MSCGQKREMEMPMPVCTMYAMVRVGAFSISHSPMKTKLMARRMLLSGGIFWRSLPPKLQHNRYERE